YPVERLPPSRVGGLGVLNLGDRLILVVRLGRPVRLRAAQSVDEPIYLDRIDSLDRLLVGPDGPHASAGSLKDAVVLEVRPRPGQAILQFGLVAVVRVVELRGYVRRDLQSRDDSFSDLVDGAGTAQVAERLEERVVHV